MISRKSNPLFRTSQNFNSSRDRFKNNFATFLNDEEKRLKSKGITERKFGSNKIIKNKK